MRDVIQLQEIASVANTIYDIKKANLGKLLAERKLLKIRIRSKPDLGERDCGLVFQKEATARIRDVERLGALDKEINVARDDVKTALSRITYVEHAILKNTKIKYE